LKFSHTEKVIFMKDRTRHFLCFLITMITAVQFFVPQSVSAKKQYTKELIYSETFDGVSEDTLASWNQAYAATAEKGNWYVGSSTTFILENRTSETDKVLSMNAHVKGQNNYFYFKFPGDIVADGIDKYEITFDYYANGSWCDWFYLTNKEGKNVNVNMELARGWHSISMTIDLENHVWKIGNYACPAENIASVLNGSDLTLITRLHNDAENGATIKFDNFKVYKLYESTNYEIYDETISLYNKSGSLQEDVNEVDIKLGRITVDFGAEELEESTITENSVSLSGDVLYETSYENGLLSLEIKSKTLDFDKEYVVTFDGLMLKNDVPVVKKEFSFRTMKNETIVSDEAYIEYEDFEDWTNATCSSHYSNSIITTGGFRTWTTKGIVTGKDGGNALTPMAGTLQVARSLEYYFVPKLENDTFIVEFDYYPGDIENYSDMKFSIFRSKDGTGTTVLPKDAMTSFSGEWGHVKIEAKPSQSTWSVVLTDGSGNVVYENLKGTWVDSDIRMFQWNVSVKDVLKLDVDENLPKIDNFIVNADYKSEPVLSGKSVKVFEDNTEQNLSDVSPASDRVVVDFGQRMMPEDMKSGKIYLTIKGNSSKIATIDKYSGGKYEMSPVDYLEAGKVYTVHIEKCHNVSGIEMSKAYTFDFTAGKGVVETELKHLTQNGAEVMNVADLSSGDAKLGVFYKNSTGKAYTLHYIIAFFQDDEMVGTTYATAELSDYATGQITDVAVTVPQVSAEYDEMNIIVWDSFSAMLPVCKALVLK